MNDALGRVLARRSGASPMGTMSVSATGGIASDGLGSEAGPVPHAEMAMARMVAQSVATVGAELRWRCAGRARCF